MRSDKTGNAEMGLQLEHPTRGGLGLICTAEARQGSSLQHTGEAKARIRLYGFLAYRSRFFEVACCTMGDAERGQWQIDRRVVWAEVKRTLAIRNRLRRASGMR
jgi:hypothetical protein